MVSRAIERYKVLAAGVLSLVLLIGIARFAYTPLLPIMQQQGVLGIAAGGWLAAINYLGYLCGAIIASRIGSIVLKDKLFRAGLLLALVTTAGMGLTDNLWLWLALRFLAGLSSAAGFLLGSALILHWLMRHNYRSELGIHFSGAGLGIAVSALAAEAMQGLFDWREQWLVFSALGALLLVPSYCWLPKPSGLSRGGQELPDRPPSRQFLRLFMAAYFCAGVGFVVSATFIVAIVDQLPGLHGSGWMAFLVMGLAAAPACILWDFIARRYGHLNALFWAFSLQIVGVLLPLFSHTLIPTLIGAALFGATFIGLVSLVLTMAGLYYPSRPAKMMGTLTIAYGIAQIMAPAITGSVAAAGFGYNFGLLMAAASLAIGSVIILRMRRLQAPQ
ncbi:MAG: putative MFS family arabinose efflux permease [Paraglaciecola psychrophila]